jgi:hypothetical protein
MVNGFSHSRPSLTRAFATLASAVGLLAVIGCADDGLGKRYSVSGKVTYKNEPLKVGAITFYAVGGQNAETRGATGSINDGYYTLSTIGGDDGAFPGEYQVAISSRQADMSQAKANAEKVGGSYRQDDVAKAYKNAPSSIPARYGSTDTSKLKATVEARSNTINFDLTD